MRLRNNGILVLALLAQACATAPLPSPEITSDWKVQHGQAVWTPPKTKNGIAGELLVATNASGDFIVEFSKPPITIASTQRVGKNWQVNFPAEGREFRGRGSGPTRIIWLHLAPALTGLEGAWNLTARTNGWKLERNGERLEGFLAP